MQVRRPSGITAGRFDANDFIVGTAVRQANGAASLIGVGAL
jgi:hypothetical protein